MLAVAGSGGAAEVLVPVPDNGALRGLQLVGQAVQLDPHSAIGLALSSGLRLVVGD